MANEAIVKGTWLRCAKCCTLGIGSFVSLFGVAKDDDVNEKHLHGAASHWKQDKSRSDQKKQEHRNER